MLTCLQYFLSTENPDNPIGQATQRTQTGTVF